MNKTVTVNISGFVFYIEEEAYSVLSTYINRIKSLFQSEESGEEIIDDVEARIAELFKEKLVQNKEVITMADVESVISIMGKPEDYVEGEEQGQTNEQFADQSTTSERRKLFRDPDDSKLGGVCAGLGHYLDLDPSLLRIAFILLFIFGGSGGLIYIILWIVLPKAETTAEKLRMKGERINVENIKKKVKDFSESSAPSGVSRFSEGFIEILENILKFIVKFFAVVFGVTFLFMAIGLLIAAVVLFLNPDSILNNISNSHLTLGNFQELVTHGQVNFYLVSIGTFLIAICPIIALIYFSIRLLAGKQYRSRGLSMTLLAGFIIGIVLTVSGGVRVGSNYAQQGEIETNLKLADNFTSKKMHVHVIQDDMFHSSLDWNRNFENGIELLKVADEDLINGALVHLEMRTSKTDQFGVRISKESQGESYMKATEYAENMNFNSYISGDTLYVSPYFTSPIEDGFRAQRVQIEVFVPEAGSLELHKSTRRIHTKHLKPGTTYTIKDGYRLRSEEINEENQKDKETDTERNPKAIKAVAV